MRIFGRVSGKSVPSGLPVNYSNRYRFANQLAKYIWNQQYGRITGSGKGRGQL